jgi:hypothetical protein
MMIDLTHDLRDALERLLADVEAICCTLRCYGMPVEDPDHPFHDSVAAARSVLVRAGQVDNL